MHYGETSSDGSVMFGGYLMQARYVHPDVYVRAGFGFWYQFAVRTHVLKQFATAEDGSTFSRGPATTIDLRGWDIPYTAPQPPPDEVVDFSH